MTFFESTLRMVVSMLKDALEPSATGWKSRLTAACLSLAKSWPQAENSRWVASRVSQPSMATWSALPLADRIEKFSRPWLPTMTA